MTQQFRTATVAALLVAGSLLGSAAPELKSLAFSPTVIDTSVNAAEVTLHFAIPEEASATNYIEAVFIDSSGVFRQSASARLTPSSNGAYRLSFTFPRFSTPGAWTLSQLMLSDAAGNTLLLDQDGLSGRGFPTRLDVKSSRDTVSPQLTSLDFSPYEIDTSAGPAQVRVNYTATDDLSGVSYVELSFASPSGAAREGGSVRLDPARSVSKSLVVTFPRMSEPGQWTLTGVYIADAAGNTQVLDVDGIVRAGFRRTLVVKSAIDSAPPTLTSFTFAPSSIDTTAGAAEVKVDFAASDDLSGVRSIEFSFLSPSGVVRQSGSAMFAPARSVSQSALVTFPRFSETGQWTLSGVLLTDAAGNTQALEAENLSRAGFRTALDIRSSSDTTPPTLGSVRLSTNAIDTRSGPGAVKVEFSATDDLSGVRQVEIVFVSPSGSSHHAGSGVFQAAREVSDAIKVTFPRSSEPGAWAVSAFMITDSAGNTLTFDSDALASMFPGGLRVE